MKYDAAEKIFVSGWMASASVYGGSAKEGEEKAAKEEFARQSYKYVAKPIFANRQETDQFFADLRESCNDIAARKAKA